MTTEITNAMVDACAAKMDEAGWLPEGWGEDVRYCPACETRLGGQDNEQRAQTAEEIKSFLRAALDA